MKRLVSIKSNRGLRFIKGLPIRGQRTHSNSKTSKKRKINNGVVQFGRTLES